MTEYLKRMTFNQLSAFFKQKSYRIKTDERRRFHGGIKETLMQECALMEMMERFESAREKK